MATKMRATKSIKTLNKTRRQDILGITKIPIIYLIKTKMSSTKIIIRFKTLSLTIRTIRDNDKRWILQYAKEFKSKKSDILDSSSTLIVLPPWKNLNVTLSRDFKCEKPQETSLPKINRKNNKRETLHDDILNIEGQAISKTKLDIVSHKNIPRIMYMENGTTIIKRMEYKFKLQMKGN